MWIPVGGVVGCGGVWVCGFAWNVCGVRVLLCVRCLVLGWCLWVIDGSGVRLGLGVWALFVAV